MKNAKKTDGRKKSAPKSPFPAFSPEMAFPTLFYSAAKMQGQMLHAYLSYNTEILDFLKKRIAEDIKLVDSVTQTDDANEAATSFVDFWREAVVEYSGEAGKLASINSKFALDAVEQLSAEAKTVEKEFVAANAA
ncbi:MAG: hypothetical protein ABJN26_14655 [Stappiaceae bacterium]